MSVGGSIFVQGCNISKEYSIAVDVVIRDMHPLTVSKYQVHNN